MAFMNHKAFPFRVHGFSKTSVMRALAYGLNRLWIAIMFFSPVLFSQYAVDSRWLVVEQMFTASLASLTVSLALLGIFFQITMKLFEQRHGRWLGPVVAGLGILLITPDIINGVEPSIRTLVISSLGTGLGSALVLLDVGRSYSVANRRECSLEVLFATALAAPVLLLLHFMPFQAALGLSIILPFLTVFCVQKSNSSFRATSTQRKSRGEKLSKQMMARFIIAAFILGAVTGFMRDVYVLNNEGPFGFEYTLLFSIGGLAATVIIGLTIILRRSFTMENLYKPALFLCVIGYAISPAFGAGTPWPFIVVSIGYTLFEILVWVILSELANRFQYTSVQVFGIGRALVLAVGMLAGFLLSNIMAGVGALDIQTLIFISATAVSMIVITLGFILPDRVLESFEADNQVDPYQHNEGRGWLPIDSRQKNTRDGRQQKLPMLARCQLIGKYHHLSPREVDVFYLLACGRNAARIQEELVISAGTVNTHLRHVYQKLGVHTQQELIDLMQASDLDKISAELARR
jgi:DNA-binding CsgD family transcriptional regulator